MKIVLNKNENYEIKRNQINLKEFIIIAENLKKFLPRNSKLRKSILNLGISCPGISCPRCKSFNITKRGFRYNHFSSVQKYQCHNPKCRYAFSLNKGFIKRMRTPKSIQEFAKKKRAEGLSYEKIQKEILNRFKIKLSRQTVHRWFKKVK